MGARRAALLLLGASFACTSLGGLSGGGEDAGGEDESGADAGPIDGQLWIDHPDAPDAAEAAQPFACGALWPKPLDCEDFDQSDAASSLGQTATLSGGTVRLDTQMFLSPPRSVRFETPALPPDAAVAAAHLVRYFSLPVTPVGITLRLDIRVDSADPGEANVLALAVPQYELAFFVGNHSRLREGVRPDGGAAVYTSTDVTQMPLQAWVHVDVEIDINPGDLSSSVALFYDERMIAQVPLSLQRYLSNGFRLDVGNNYVPAPDLGRQVHLDNLVVDVK